MTKDKNLLQGYKKFKISKITASNAGILEAIGKGNMKLSENPPITIPDVLYVPKLTKTSVATNSLTKKGYQINIRENMNILAENGDIILTASNHNGLYYLTASMHEANSTTAEARIDLLQAHKKFGHACNERLYKLPDNCEGIQIKNSERPICNGCALGQARRQPFPEERKTKPTRKFEIVSTDLKSPLLVTSQGYQYYIT